MSKKTPPKRSRTFPPGKVLKFKAKVEIPQELKIQGVGPFTVLRKEGAYIYLIGQLAEFRISNFSALKLFESCSLKIRTSDAT